MFPSDGNPAAGRLAQGDGPRDPQGGLAAGSENGASRPLGTFARESPGSPSGLPRAHLPGAEEGVQQESPDVRPAALD